MYRRGSDRIDFYPTTGAVKTMVSHPKRGRNELFRKNLTSLQNPTINWEALAGGYGVTATTSHTVEDFKAQLKIALEVKGPRLIVAKL